MPARLVYSPKVYAFTKNSEEETLNISPWIVSGDVVRNLDAASTASIVLRNPDKIFTTPKNGIAFHPQDPITIYLERLAGYPVRVFTGYLDETPYLQLQPSVIQLQATCTLKRLKYTYFDPSLPYMISFFEKYGWFNTGQGSIISASSVGASNLAQNKMKLENSSIARLLWGVLYDIGEWNDTDIWIEPIPTGANGIVNRVLTLMKQFDQQNTQAADELQQVFNTMLGSSGIGSGNSTPLVSLVGNTYGQKIFDYLTQSKGMTAIAASGIIGNFLVEDPTLDPARIQNNFNKSQIGHPGVGFGIAQFTNYAPNRGDYQAFATYCNGRGYPPVELLSLDPNTLLTLELDYIYSDLPAYALTELNSATTPAEAAATFYYSFEDPQARTDPAVAQQQNLIGRQQNAQQAYTQYAQGTSRKGGKHPSTKNAKTTQKVEYNPSMVFTNNPLANMLPGFNKQATSSTQIHTVYDAIVAAANALASSKLPYPNPLNHFGSLAQPWPAYDCSGSVSFVLYAAGLLNADKGNAPQGFATPDEAGILKKAGFVKGASTHPMSVTIWVNPKPGANGHTFMCIGGNTGRYWGTSTIKGPFTNSLSQSGAGAWLQAGNSIPFSDIESQKFTAYHLPHSKLMEATTYQAPGTPGNTSIPPIGEQSNGTGSVGSALSSGTSGNTISQSSAEAFTQQLAFPTIEDSIVAILLGGEGKGLMHDQELLPFVQQVTQSSLRHFTSLPDGSFYAFYPDYFGEMGQHDPYWYIDDIEIVSGTINVTDQGLATHVFAVGDNCLSLDTPIPTPNGWTTMEHLQKGDQVFGSDGKIINILSISETHQNRECYEITFSDGTKITTDHSHLWEVRTRQTNKKLAVRGDDQCRIISTQEMFDQGITHQANIKYPSRYNWAVKVAAPLEYPEKDLPIDPYLLGYWLGDGESHQFRITVDTKDHDNLIKQINEAQYGHRSVYTKNTGSLVQNISESRYHYRVTVYQQRPKLRELGILYNKRIPTIYLEGSVEQREALLQGLMDSDGSCSNGQCVISQVKKDLAQDILQLTRSLGFRGTIHEKIVYNQWVVEFAPNDHIQAFRLPRKLAKYNEYLESRKTMTSGHRSIVDISRVDSVPTKCILVDAEDHLFLASEAMIPTHNTWPINNQLMNELFSAGTITVFNAFDTKGKTIEGDNRGPIMDTKEALAFIKRYGARPVVQDYPMVRSGVFEMLMAYQLFQLMWALQFVSDFTFTFMPELFPGGKVGFPSHGLMMYIEQVTHIFDYEAGFTTTAQLMAPSVMAGYNGEEVGLPPNMSLALVEPINHTDISPKVHKNVNSTTKKQPPRIGSGFRVASNS